MTAVLLVASWSLAAAGILLGGLALAATRRVQVALGILLDLLLAAGLLRLVLADRWSAIATAAALVVIRKVVVLGLSAAESPGAATTSAGGHGPAAVEHGAGWEVVGDRAQDPQRRPEGPVGD